MVDPEGAPSEPAPDAQPGDPSAPEAQPPAAQPPVAETGDAQPPPPYLPLAAYPVPSVAPAPPPLPTWAKVYEVPTARSIVSAGIQLVVDSTAAIRRASIYIGLLALGAFGPAVLLILLGVGKLLSDPATAGILDTDLTRSLVEQPDLVGPLVLTYVLGIVGFILLIAISIDAEAMAISILGGHASELPLRLWESVLRARQVFWRLFGAGILVGIVSTVVTLVVTLPFIRPFDTNTGITFIGSMIGALVITPFVFAPAGIVLGDVGAIEALRRSLALFRARPRIALVVTMFTLVTSAIQTFAFGAGADVALRVGEALHLSLDQGGLPLLLTAVIVLAFVVAFGSLTFTIAAIVAAPQVTGFLGLTYFSAGLDRARSSDGVRPRRFRWVSLPMAITMAGLAIVAGLGVPTISGFEARLPSMVLAFLTSAGDAEDVYVDVFGPSSVIEDPVGDGGASSTAMVDIVSGEYGYLSEVPAWLLDGVFKCQTAGVTCTLAGSRAAAFSEGAILFAQRMAVPGGKDITRGVLGPALRVTGSRFAPSPPGDRFPGASHVYMTRADGTTSRIVKFERFAEGKFSEASTDARSTWVGDSLITLVPARELAGYPLTWDVFACASGLTTGIESCDFLRATVNDPMFDVDDGPDYLFFGGFDDPFDPFAP